MRVGQSRKRDKIEPEVRQALHDIGLFTFPISAPKVGDILVYDPWANKHASWTPLEIKSGNGKLTKQQQEREAVAPCPLVRSVEEALALYIHRVH
jgi:hypothetical protein